MMDNTKCIAKKLKKFSWVWLILITLFCENICFRTLRKSYPKSEHQEGKREEVWKWLSHARAGCAHSNSDVVFYCVQVSHEDENCKNKRVKNF